MTPQEKLKFCRTFNGRSKWPSLPGMLGFFWEAESKWVKGEDPTLEEGETIESVLQDYHLMNVPMMIIPDELRVMMLTTIRRVLLGKGYRIEEKERLSEKFHYLYADYFKTTSK